MPILSMTAIPPRFDRLGPVFESLLAQSVPLDEIRLYVPRRYRRFPDYDGSAPDVPRGVTVVRIEEDLGPCTKIVPALQDFRGEDVTIVYCDDDRAYGRNWVRGLLRGQREAPGAAIAAHGVHLDKFVPGMPQGTRQPRSVKGHIKHDWDYYGLVLRQMLRQRSLSPRGPKPERCQFRKGGYADILFGSGGVAVKPAFFDDDVFDIPEPMIMNDDFWISAQLERRDVGIWVPARIHLGQRDPGSEIEAIHGSHIATKESKAEDFLFRTRYLQERYGIWQ